jgi:arylsulfatase A-like enzyme
MLRQPTPRRLDSLAPAWVAIGLAVGLWEVFLRVDSRAITTGTKLWLLPLLAATVTGSSLLAGGLIHRLIRIGSPSRLARWLELLTPVVASAIAFAAEYAGVAHYHAPEIAGRWPLAALAGATFAIAALLPCLGRLRETDASRNNLAGVGTFVVGLAVLSLLGTTGAVAALRPDVGACLLRQNSIAGRALALPLRNFRNRPSADPAVEMTQLPHLRSSNPLGASDLIVVTVDTLRADALSVYQTGTPRTPVIERFAEKSIVFDDMFVQRPTSAPSVASLFTGLYPMRHAVRNNAMILPDGVNTLAERLQHAGFQTAGFVTNVNFVRDFRFDQGFDTYEYFDTEVDPDGLLLDSADPVAVSAALSWAAQHVDRGRMFLWLHLMAPHAPYLPPEDLRQPPRPGDGPWLNALNMPFHVARLEGGRAYFDRKVYLDSYAAEVASVDREFGRLLAGLERIGLADRAHVVFAADHGESFGERDKFGHGTTLDPSQTRIPFIWKLPRSERAGARISMTAQAADFVPTVLTIMGFDSLEFGRSTASDGRDISGVLLGEVPEDAGFAFSDAGYRGTLGSQGLTYAVRDATRSLRLDAGFPYRAEFARAEDRTEAIAQRHRPRDDDALEARLEQLAYESEAQLDSGTQQVATLDADQRERLRALGYIW